MGNNQSLKEYNDESIKEMMKNFTFVRQEKTSMGVMKIYKNNENGQLIMAVSKNFSTQKQQDEFIQNLTLVKKNNEVNVLGYLKESSQTMCGSNFTVQVFNEYFEHDLEKEITKRSLNEELFSEAEVRYIMQNILSIFTQYQTLSDLRPSQLYLSNEGFLKYNAMFEQDLYSKAMIQNERCYLSPELMENLKNKQVKVEVDQFKSNLFSMGVTLLSMCTLQKLDKKLYDWTNKVINFEQIEQLLMSLQTKYSFDLLQTLKQLLQEDFNQRYLMQNTTRVINNTRHVVNPVAQSNIIPVQNQQFVPVQQSSVIIQNKPQVQQQSQVIQQQNQPQVQQQSQVIIQNQPQGQQQSQVTLKESQKQSRVQSILPNDKNVSTVQDIDNFIQKNNLIKAESKIVQ